MRMNKHLPTFSIITVTLNNLAGLQKTQTSITKQTCTDYEWLVIDGESTDGTRAFLQENAVTFISEKDLGIYDAMNTGIRKATGRYLLFLNAGDVLAAPDVLEYIRSRADKNPDFIYGDALEPRKGESRPVYKTAQNPRNMPWGMITHHQAMLYRRSIIRDRNMHYSLRYTVASDYDFTARFLQHAQKTAYIKNPVCIFEQGGLSQQQAALGRREQYIIRENLDMVSQGRNLWIFVVQAASWSLRTRFPALYNGLKRAVHAVMNRRKR